MTEVLYWLAACLVMAWMVGEWRDHRRRRRIRRVLDEVHSVSVPYPAWPRQKFDGDYEWQSERGFWGRR